MTPWSGRRYRGGAVAFSPGVGALGTVVVTGRACCARWRRSTISCAVSVAAGLSQSWSTGVETVLKTPAFI
ncbi:MAG TPA: hypothetical protein P5186_13805 [Candidatus Paceibacterota bacterium]|nr:hypothetical protein [Candidatus Paceibacterota bacterium]